MFRFTVFQVVITNAPSEASPNTGLFTSKFNLSSAHGLTTDFVIELPETVNLVSKSPGVVSFNVIAVFLSAPAAAAIVESVISALLSSLNIIFPSPSKLILNRLPETVKSNVVVVFPPSLSNLLLIAVLISDQN